MKYILGTKIGMVQLYDVNGRAIPSTIVHCEPNQVLEVKSLDKHGVNGVKVGYFSTKENKTNKAHAGIFKKAGANLAREIRSFTDIDGSYNVGDLIKVDFFNVGEYVDVQGISKGHGFTGAIKR
jgi:large subunit ribosomal protein L3